ncbi:hypothetical protein FACS189437_08330 [Bacteroidia bacterium]|nr:hypothetical protein FACS189437_08330 [Bacteroidia bacterium]
MKISVVIPIYNVAAYIERCLLSVMNQIYQDIECVLVDDASPDNSLLMIKQLLSSYKGTVSFTIISHEYNQGVSAARNTGIKKATGDYIYFLDGDDELPPDGLKILLDAILKYDAEIAVGAIKVTGGNSAGFPSLHVNKETCRNNEAVFSSYLRKEWYDMAWNKLIKKTTFKNWEEPFKTGIIHGEDSLFSFQLASKSRSVIIVPEITYYYHIHPASITQQKSKKNIDSIYLIINEMITYAHKENLFASFSELPSYLEKQRVYFIKSLIRGKFDKNYIREQRNKIDRLYKKEVWNGNKRKMEFLLKDFVLSLWFYFTLLSLK